MVKKTHSKVFEMPKKLSVTFDGDLLDMIRCKHIIKAIVEDKLLENATEMSTYFTKQLSSLNAFKHIRSIGLLFCVDLASKSQRDILVKQLFEKGMICNPTGKKSIRMRPNLAVKKEEIDHALDIIKDCFL